MNSILNDTEVSTDSTNKLANNIQKFGRVFTQCYAHAMSMCISMSREAKHVPIDVCVCVQSDNPFFCLSRKVSESESAVEAPILKERTNVVSWESITNTNKIEEKNKIICAVHTSEQKRENAEQSVDLKKYTHTDERTKLVCWYWYACQDFECIGLFVWNGTVMLIKTFFFSWPRNQCKKGEWNHMFTVL